MTLTTPTHRRAVRTDATPTAQCSVGCLRGAGVAMCPKHRPADYAIHMARHSIDSIPVEMQREQRFHTWGVTR